jgi:glycosyltransferase involved in cell wall biosynthesis
MILLADAYRVMPVHTTFLAMPPVAAAWHHPFDQLVALGAVKQPYGGPAFDAYLAELAAEVAELIQRHRPDVIHAQHLGFGLSPAFARAAGRVPIISIAHGTDVLAADHLEQARDVLTEVVAASAAVVAPNTTLAEHIDRLTAGRYTNRLTVLPWGIPVGDAVMRGRRRRRPPDGTGPLTLLHAGRLDENKSTVTAIEALAITRQPHRLTVIGSGPELDHLVTRAYALGVQDRVVFEPFLPRPQLWRRFGDFDAFVFTTAELEAFGLIAIEAQAHGLPVAYSNVAGIGTTLGHAGAPYTPGDPASLAAALDELARDTHWRHAITHAGLDNARRYDVTTTAAQLTALTVRTIGMVHA